MTDADKESLRTNREPLEQALRDAGAVIKGNTVKCPFHDDKRPSMSIGKSDKGIWRVKCHANVCQFTGDVFDVRAKAAGKQPGDVLRDLTPQQKEAKKDRPKWFASIEHLKRADRNLETCFVYDDPKTGKVDMVVLRLRLANGDKKFIQCRPENGGFVMQAPPVPRPLYNRKGVASSSTIIVVEGEKCADHLTSIGIAATTAPGGAGNSRYADWSAMAGKTAFLWPDNDDAGIKHMKEVATELQKLEPRPTVLWIDPQELDLERKGDVVDYLEPYGVDDVERRRAIEAAMAIASPMGPADGLEKLIEDTISGKRKAIPFPWGVLTRLTQALLPGTVTVLCGDPGSTKSFFILEAAWRWHESNVKVAVLELEDDQEFHLNRVLAQREENGELTDLEWVRQNPEVARSAMSRHRKFLDSFAPCIQTPKDESVTLDDVLAWIRQRCAEGYQIVAVDPITAAESTDKAWLADRKFIMEAKAIIRQYGARLILNTHPKLGAASATRGALHSMAGGAAYPRFAHTVLWIQPHDKPKRVTVEGPYGSYPTKINRSIRISKARNGRGAGLELGYLFEGKSLRFAEQGAVVREVKGEQLDAEEVAGV